MKQIIPILLLFASNLLTAQSLVIEPSRTSGTAPLYVFFDATSSTGLDGVNDLPNADFTWDFDVNNNDPNGNWEVTKGMVAGHVFEAPGTYTVSCTMIARNGAVDTQEVTISVSDFSGTTYYVAENGNGGSDDNDGLSESTPWETANFAFDQLTANSRLLFNRGDTFEEVTYRIQNLGESGIRIGVYGSGEKPRLIAQLNERILDVRNTQDIVISDLHFVNIADSTNTNGALDMQDSTNHALVLRCEVEGTFGNAIYSHENHHLGVFDCYFHDFEYRSFYSRDTRRMSFVGNVTDNIFGVRHQSHGIRVQRGEKQFVAHNTFTNMFQTKTGMTFRGDGQRHVMIYKNKLDRIIQVAPTTFQHAQYISLVTLEGNYIGQNPAYDDAPDIGPSLSGMNIISSEIVIRNNVFDGMHRGMSINAENIEMIPSDVDVYHNTMNWRPVVENSGDDGIFARVDDVGNINIRNNLMTASAAGEMRIQSGGNNTNLVESNNLMTITPNFVSGTLPNSQADENDATNYGLTEESSAVNQGSLDVPVFFDQTGGKRYFGSAPDVGAFEYDDGGDVTNPDPSEGRDPDDEEEEEEDVLASEIDSNGMLFPNPTSNYFTTALVADVVEIFDASGRKVLSNPLEKVVDISTLEEGVYLVVLKRDDNSEVFKGRVIKRD